MTAQDATSKDNVIDLRSRAAGPGSEALMAVRDVTLRTLPGVLASVLDRSDDALFDFVQKSINGLDQQEYFDTMRDLRRSRAAIEQRFAESLRAGFDALERGRPIVVRCAPRLEEEAKQELSLLGADELDEQLAAEQLAGALERRHSGPLNLLNKRLAILVQLPTLGAATNPLGPGHVVHALRLALEGVVHALPPRLVVYKIYERDMQSALTTVYAEANRLLAGVMIDDPAKLDRARHRDVPKSPKHPHLYAERSAPAGPVGEYAPNTYGQGSGAGYSGDSQDVDELLPTLRALLSEYRAARRSAAPPAAAAEARPTMDIRGAISTLSRLQPDLPAMVQQAIEDPTASLSMLLKTEVLRQAERLGLTGPDSQLEERSEESLELVGMLFDALLGQRNFERVVRDQMARMVVPYAKASLLDQHMFAMKSHPARQLLNTVAEACDGNRGETSAERELLGRVEGTVDRLVTEFNEDLAIFSELDGELKTYFDQHKQRAHLVERRAAEAQRGKERLDEARAMANGELAELMGGRSAPPAIEQFLSHYWTHHISVVALRDGADSARFKSARQAGEHLWHAFLGSEQGAPRPVDLRDQLIAVLVSSGVTGVSADETIGAIEWVLQALRLGRLDAANSRHLPAVITGAPKDSAADVAKAGTAKAEVPVDDASEKTEVAVEAVEPAFDPEDVERIKALKVGNWVEFMAADGTPQPAKLSWISPISSRLLFVNRRGMRLCASSAEELALQIREGTLALRSADSAFERAMDQVLGKLRDNTPA